MGLELLGKVERFPSDSPDYYVTSKALNEPLGVMDFVGVWDKFFFLGIYFFVTKNCMLKLIYYTKDKSQNPTYKIKQIKKEKWQINIWCVYFWCIQSVE